MTERFVYQQYLHLPVAHLLITSSCRWLTFKQFRLPCHPSLLRVRVHVRGRSYSDHRKGMFRTRRIEDLIYQEVVTSSWCFHSVSTVSPPSASFASPSLCPHLRTKLQRPWHRYVQKRVDRGLDVSTKYPADIRKKMPVSESAVWKGRVCDPT
jgi:hypothetical protein